MLLLLLHGCLLAPIDERIYLEDVDEDGFTAIEGDCAPEEASRNPDADERCNGLDDDCDGVADNDPVDGQTYYPDADGDTYGDPSLPLRSCEPVEGYVDNDADCNDAEAGITIEQDWFRDADGDGHGDSSQRQTHCDPGPGWVTNGDDCNDTDPDEVPGQSWFRDNDLDGFGSEPLGQQCARPIGGVANDDDCDDADPDERPDQTWYPDSDGDDWGTGDTATVQCERPDDAWAPRNGDCLDDDDDVNPGTTETCGDGIDNDCDPSTSCLPPVLQDVGVTDSTDWRLIGAHATLHAGRYVHAKPLVVDGRAALMWVDNDQSVWGIYGVNIERTETTDELSADFELTNGGTAGFGALIETVYTSESNVRDVLVTDAAYDDRGTVVMFAASSATGSLSWEPYGAYIAQDRADEEFGGGLAPCPGFGGGKYLIGAPNAAFSQGRVYLMDAWPPEGAETQVAAGLVAQATIKGDLSSAQRFGESVACFDRQGNAPAIAVGAKRSHGTVTPLAPASERGAVYIYSGVGDWAGVLGPTDATITLLGPETGRGNFGLQVLNAGDFDGDGLDDLLVGAPHFDDGDETSAGKVYLVSGAVPASTNSDVDDLGEYLLGTFTVGLADTQLGHSLAAGDFNGDGLSDIAIGGPLLDRTSSTPDAGAVWVFLGGRTDKVHHDLLDDEDAGRLEFYTTQGDAQLGKGVAFGDFDNDGYDDLAMSAPNWTSSVTNGGAIFIVFGTGE